MYLKNAVLAADAPEPGAKGAVYHLCENETCGAPIPDEEALRQALEAFAATVCAAVN